MNPVIVTLTRFTDIFECLNKSISIYEPSAEKIVVTSGNAKIISPGWTILKGIEPFVFSRNVNLAFKAVDTNKDILLLNDDCCLCGPILDHLQQFALTHPQAGIISPQIVGGVGNMLQSTNYKPSMHDYYLSTERLCFVCVYIPAKTRQIVGLMDEKFIGYGGDDDDYCLRVQRAGFSLAITTARVIHGHGNLRMTASFSRTMSESERKTSMYQMVNIVK